MLVVDLHGATARRNGIIAARVGTSSGTRLGIATLCQAAGRP
jgi:hypothetical protein